MSTLKYAVALALLWIAPATADDSLSHIPHLITTISDSLAPEAQEAFSSQMHTLLILLKNTDEQMRAGILSSLESTLSLTKRRLQSHPRALRHSKKICSTLSEMCEVMRTTVQPLDKGKERFWHSTPQYPAYPYGYYSWTEPLKYLIPFALVAIVLLVKIKACETSIGNKNNTKYIRRADRAEAFTAKLTTLVTMLLNRYRAGRN